MLLTGKEIIREVENGNILIDPFDPSLVGYNSVDVRLGKELIELFSNSPNQYIRFDLTRNIPWDLTVEIPYCHTIKHTIESRGFLLQKGIPYLAHTIETIHSSKYVPYLDARSTVGRYFLQCHMTAGKGDVGWGPAQFTMELMSMANDLQVYEGLPIAQISFFSLQGEITLYKGRYPYQMGPTLPKPIERKTNEEIIGY